MTLPDPPYPADTLARGWRFEVDMETVKRSDTWKKARTGAMRGALLLLWAESWQEKPCGTLPDDDELIAIMIDMPVATFAKHRELLRRGWTQASDGRLYHETITARVLAMLEKRAKDAKRAADNRARRAASADSPPEVTRASRVTRKRQTGEFDTKHQALSTSSSAPDGAGGDPPPPPVEKTQEQEKRELYTAGKSLLHLRGMAKEQCGSFITKLATDYGQDNALKAVRAAVAAQPLDAVEYLKATCMRLKGERVDPATVPSDAADKTQAYLAEQAAHQRAAPPADLVAKVRKAVKPVEGAPA
jgi:hypothetical protein